MECCKTNAERVCWMLCRHLETHKWNDKVLMEEIYPLAKKVLCYGDLTDEEIRIREKGW